jgi:ribonuclease III
LKASYLDVRDVEGFTRPPAELQERIGIRFENEALLRAALTHPSYWGDVAMPDSERLARSYERLEFLGDSVIALTVCTSLFKQYPEDNQGVLSKVKAHLVSKRVLLDVATRIELGNYIRVGRGVEESAGRDHKTFLVDCFESLVGSIFLDKGFERARDFTLEVMRPDFEEIGLADIKDFKTTLQELIQKNHRCLPKYKLVQQSGPEHNKLFEIEVYVNGDLLGTGAGRSKKEAQIDAARQALLNMNCL